MLDFNCVVGVWMNRAPPLPRSGGVEARLKNQVPDARAGFYDSQSALGCAPAAFS